MLVFSRSRALLETDPLLWWSSSCALLVLSILGVWESLFPGVDVRVLAASPMFWWPGSREMVLLMGAVDAARKVAQAILNTFHLNLLIYTVCLT